MDQLLLTGEYEQALDSKGRVLIPSKLRARIDAVEHGGDFYLVLGANGILCLYPEKLYGRFVLALAPKAQAPDEAIAFERMSFALSGKVELDSQGRLLLNERLRKKAGLKDSVILLGVGDHIELWNAADWEQYQQDHMSQYQQQAAQARQAVIQKLGEQVESGLGEAGND